VARKKTTEQKHLLTCIEPGELTSPGSVAAPFQEKGVRGRKLRWKKREPTAPKSETRERKGPGAASLPLCIRIEGGKVREGEEESRAIT